MERRKRAHFPYIGTKHNEVLQRRPRVGVCQPCPPSHLARSYFKCANSNCGALKIEEPCNDNTSMLWVTYIGQHTCQHSENADHSSTPLFHESSRALSSLADSSASPVPIIMEEGESQKKLVEDSSEHSSPTSQDAADRVSELCPSNQMEVSNDGKEQQVKYGRNLKELGRSKNFAPMTFAIKTDKAVLKDGFMWSKYGRRKLQRNRIGSLMPRSYYKCAKSNCRAGKQVHRCDDDDSILIITYWGRHTCIPSENADTSGGEAVKAFPDLADSSTGRVPIFMEEGEFENKFVEDSSIYFHPTSSHQLDDFPSWNADPVFGELNQPVNYNEEGDVISLHDVLPASTTSSLYKLSAGTKVLLTLEITSLGESIFVGVAHHTVSSETLEFYFFNAKDMAKCVGVGLAQAKVTLHDDLSITIEETDINEKELQNTWMPLLSDRSSNLVMRVEMDTARTQAYGHDHLGDTSVREKGEALSRLCGVGFDCPSQYVNETYDAAEISWPLLYDMALFILTPNADLQCNETNETASTAQGSGSNLEGNNIQSSIRGKLHGEFDAVSNKGNFQDGQGDGDEDGFGCNSTPPSDDDDPPVVLKVTVHPLTRRDILETHVTPNGLEGASIAPKLVFEFCRNQECKRISIKTHSRLELASHMDVFYNANLFGWYHTGIQISFGCEDTEGHVESGRVALLKQSSCRILNPTTSCKYTTAKSIVSSKEETCTIGGQGSVKVGSALLGGTELQGSWSGARMQQVAASNGGNIETTRETVCGGFSFRDRSSTEFPARASFLLFYPLDNVSIWGDREFLQGQGLFSTIEPSIEGTWIPLNGLDASPYLFKVARSLKFHERSSAEGLGDRVLEHKQEYILPFYVNHAMSHLKSQRSKHIELSGDRQLVPNVLQVGSAVY